MSVPSIHAATRHVVGTWLPGLLLLIYPALFFAIRGAGSAILMIAALMSLVVLWWRGRAGERVLDRVGLIYLIAMAAPVAVVAGSELRHGRIEVSTFDAPLRFLVAAPVFLALRGRADAMRPWLAWSYPLGACAALVLIITVPEVAGNEYWLNRIHFGNVALAVGLLSLLAIDWPRPDSKIVRSLKILGAVAGIGASLMSGTRGGWITLPVLGALFLLRWPRPSWPKKVALAGTCAVLLVLPYFVSPAVKARVDAASSDLVAFAQGDADTSLGVRIQHWRVAAYLVREDPLFGAGANGYREALPQLEQAGVISPLAAGFAELHSQPLAYAADYGLLGLAGLLLAQLAPVALVWGRTRSHEPCTHRAAWLLVTWSVSFLVFGLSQEIFSLKSTASFFACVTAVLAAVALKHPVDDTDARSGAAR
jgi:O-antigen ligase